MPFNSTIFLFFFIPVVIAVHALLRQNKLRNGWLLLASILFFAWGSEQSLVFLLAYGMVNYGLVQIISRHPAKKLWVAVGVCADVAVLFLFKYLNLAISTLNRIPGIALPLIQLFQPLGISFITFTAIAYIVDVYKGTAPALKSPFDFFLYLFLFPKVSQGPIVRYEQVGGELAHRQCTFDSFTAGLKRFIIGLAKKCLIADILGKTVDMVFTAITGGISIGTAWLGILFYTFQIYYDFSGYTDMAIGIGKMLGFSLPENFDAPYRSKSVSEFWRRWHMTLGQWFRNYIYIPLGGNRKGLFRTMLNLAVVWMVTGIWHGASYLFILWGMYYGALVITEKLISKRKWYQRIPAWLKWTLTFLAVVFGWTIFRAESVGQLVLYWKAMFGLSGLHNYIYETTYLFDLPGMLAFFAAVCLALPVPKALRELPQRSQAAYVLQNGALLILFLLSVLFMVNSTYHSFIYFQF